MGRNGNPEWKWTLSSTWTMDEWQVGFMTQYIDSVIQDSVLDANLNPWLVDTLQTYTLTASTPTKVCSVVIPRPLKWAPVT
jgi:hypothetical protein